MNKDIKLSTRKKILDFQSMLISNADEENIVTHQDSKLFPLKHTFADGIYVRQMSMDQGSIVVGAGTKRVIYANKESIFVNIHKNPTNSQDIKWLEKEIVATSIEEYEEYINKNK